MKCCHQFRMLAVLCARAPPYTVATKSYGRTATSDAERRAAPRVRAEAAETAACQRRTRARGGDRHVEVVSSVVFDSRLAPHGGARRTSASGSREQGTSPRPEPPSARTSKRRTGRFARSGKVLDRCPKKCPFVSRMFRSNDKEKTYDDDLSSPLLARSIPQAKLNHYLL